MRESVHRTIWDHRVFQTPIVKASGRELSYMLLSGILICYGNTFALLAKPSTVTCAIQRLGESCFYTI